MKNRNKERDDYAVPPETIAAERVARLEKIFKKVFPGLNRSQIAVKLEVSEGTIRKWESGGEQTTLPLARLAQHGGDVHYLLTGEHRENRKEPPEVDPLTSLIAPPDKCPNHGLCVRLAKLVRLQRELSSTAVLAGIDDKELEVCILALAKYKAEKAKAAAVETYFQGSVTG